MLNKTATFHGPAFTNSELSSIKIIMVDLMGLLNKKIGIQTNIRYT